MHDEGQEELDEILNDLNWKTVNDERQMTAPFEADIRRARHFYDFEDEGRKKFLTSNDSRLFD